MVSSLRIGLAQTMRCCAAAQSLSSVAPLKALHAADGADNATMRSKTRSPNELCCSNFGDMSRKRVAAVPKHSVSSMQTLASTQARKAFAVKTREETAPCWGMLLTHRWIMGSRFSRQRAMCDGPMGSGMVGAAVASRRRVRKPGAASMHLTAEELVRIAGAEG